MALFKKKTPSAKKKSHMPAGATYSSTVKKVLKYLKADCAHTPHSKQDPTCDRSVLQ